MCYRRRRHGRRRSKGRHACLEELGEIVGDERFTEIVALGLIAAIALLECLPYERQNSQLKSSS